VKGRERSGPTIGHWIAFIVSVVTMLAFAITLPVMIVDYLMRPRSYPWFLHLMLAPLVLCLIGWVTVRVDRRWPLPIPDALRSRLRRASAYSGSNRFSNALVSIAVATFLVSALLESVELVGVAMFLLFLSIAVSFLLALASRR
jgi:hypothetical protein